MRTFSMAGRFLTGIVAMVALIGCGSAQQRQVAETDLATPNVVMEADPPPPFTYWAPQNSTIRNHPRVDGVWIAEIEGQPTRYYSGDQCRASQFQKFIGQPLDALPEKSTDATWRTACSTCAVTSDLGRARMNVAYDDETLTITSIWCG